MPAIVVLSTFPSEHKAAEVARVLVDDRLAACVNLVTSVRSLYRWADQPCDEREVLAIIKTTTERLDALKAKLVALHPYELPEAIALPIADGHAPYLAWVGAQTTT
jgi:periplasmic divalent cation tolerance protein